ncbi:TatD family hydrolase [Bacillus sp. Marseille-P3661]|uniref:TatD family hydrolase n=1 Tax=Bacillus sp. Marseille-P3661 TaxID=1936234 RepID=UPI000C85E081|nr:TatD family hydrolase [Bacillus sp. Marseille-P3661]
MKMIDAHIHLDRYTNKEIDFMLEDSDELIALVSVSYDLESCKRNLYLQSEFPQVKAAFGFHPEQSLPTENEIMILINWMIQHRTEMIAVGEVGLPYYLRKNQEVTQQQYDLYIEYLETFMKVATTYDKPIVLHAVYDDAPIVCDLLEKHSVKKAQFHWFKGDEKTVHRMIENGYYISVTPEVVYREKIQKLVYNYPIEQLMIETDGPWQFEGPFSGRRTNPKMMKESIRKIAKIKNHSESEVAEKLLANTKSFYKM